MSGWDWLNAGLELATLAKIHKTQQDVGSMKNIQQSEQARRELISAMRNFIFEVSEDIKRVDEYIESSPLQVYIASELLQRKLIASGLSAQMFPDISDKEYYAETQRKIENVTDKAQNELNPETRSTGNKAVEYLEEIPILKEAVFSKKAEENLEETQKQWDKMHKERKKRKTFFWLGLLMFLPFVCSCPFTGILFAPITFVSETTNEFLGVLLAIFGVLVILGYIGGAIWMIIFGSKSFPDYKSLRERRQNWKNALMDHDKRNQVVSKFGDISSGEYQILLDQRINYLKPILGSDFQKLLLGDTNE